MTKIEFGRRQVANDIRNRLEGFLDDNDSRRSKTVKLQDRVPDSMVQRVREEAADSRQAEADKSGQAKLSDRERKEIDFSREGVNVPFARSVKGIADSEGVEDWLQFADLDLTVDENRSVLKRAGREERGARGRGRTDEQRNLKRAQRAKRQRRNQAETAKQPAFEGDADAAKFLREEERFEDNLFDISLRGQGPSGRDFERLQEAHENRSARARRVDERRSAEVTRDPLKWSQNKAKYDYPGIDTVQPRKLHEQRSRRARQKDEEEQAPLAESREQWARNQDRFDWPGVDTKQRPSMDDVRNQFEEMRAAKTDALFEFEPMQPADEMMAQASSRDVSFDPDLDLNEPESLEPGKNPSVIEQFAAGPEADTAFVSAEEKRANSSGRMDTDVPMFTDDRDQQASLDVGRAAGVTEDRSGEIAGSSGFEDRREELQGGPTVGEQAGLFEEKTDVGGQGQTDLFGGNATKSSGAEYLK